MKKSMEWGCLQLKEWHYVFAILTVVLAVFVVPDTLSAQQTKQVNVTLPGFTVKLNGISIDNSYRQYPLLVYQGITYFPMRASSVNCRSGGTETERLM